MRFRIVIRHKRDWPKELLKLFCRSTLVFMLVYTLVSGLRGCAVERWKNGRTINEEGASRAPINRIPV